uniref:Late endosomal/lysosomal adaptor and MAPK and MTOR activator 1 n=1 Tax=Parascaris univalens TaxID=6257 RepID=A0A915AS95_PARUN
MTAKVMSCMRAVCCCNGELSDDERPFVDSQNESDIIAARTAPTGFSSEAVNRLWTVGSANNSAQATPVARNVRSGDEEDELLNQILESTQQNIIDVTNMDGLVVAGSDDLTKAHRFEDAIEQHDVRIRKKALSTSAANGQPHSVTVMTPRPSLLTDAGVYAADYLSRPPPSPIFEKGVKDFAKRMVDAVTNGIQVEHKEDILVHMSGED